MKKYSYVAKPLFGTLLLLLLLIFAITLAHAQDTSITAVSSSADMQQEAIAQALTVAVSNRPSWLLPGSDYFTIENILTDGNYAFLSAGRSDEETTIGKDFTHEGIDGEILDHDENFKLPDTLLAVAVLTDREWSVHLEGTPEYNEYLLQLPDTLLGREAKAILLNHHMTDTTISAAGAPNTYKLSGLPWKARETWSYAQDMHGPANNGFDFATLNGRAGAVYTADTGVVTYASSTCIEIKRSDGLYHGYQHINSNDVSRIRAAYFGKPVAKGTYLGMTTTSSGCNGYSTGHHVHFYLFTESTKNSKRTFMPFGSSANGWTFAAERDDSEGLANGNHPKSGYDYPLKKGSQIACAGTTIQNRRNICTTKSLYHDPNYTTTPLCRYRVPISADSSNHGGSIFAKYLDAGSQRWGNWSYKANYNHYGANYIAMAERPAGKAYDYQFAIYNSRQHDWNYQYVRVDTQSGCANPRVHYWRWMNGRWTYWRWRWAVQGAQQIDINMEQPVIDSSLFPIPTQPEQQGNLYDLFVPIIRQ